MKQLFEQINRMEVELHQLKQVQTSLIVNHERKPDMVTSLAFPMTTKGHTAVVQVNGTTSSLLVDTGSVTSLIRQHLWKKCCMTNWNLGQND